MLYLLERLQWFIPHSLGWRIRRNQIGVFALQLLELPEQSIVLSIRNGRFIQHVIFVIVLAKLLAQLLDLLFY